MNLLKKPLFALTFFGLITSLETYGQFKKYKSSTSFNAKKNSPPNALKKKPAASLLGKSKKRNLFGRTKNQENPKIESQDSQKYVNLNPETAFGPEVVTSFDFPNTSLVDLTKHMQTLTGINLILDKDLKGKISIMAPSPITVGDAWKAYLTALNLNGYTLVRSGKFFKIVNARDIRYTPTKIYTGNFTPDTENYAMRIIPLKNINSTEVTRSFRPFMSRYGRIIDIKQTNTIIVQDTGRNINRLIQLIKFIDVPGHEETLQIIAVKNSSAQEIAKLLDRILKSGGSSKFRSRSKNKNISKIIAEPRTNSIIAMANADGAKKLKVLINRLDVKHGATGSGQIHVYYLNYGNAESLSKTLSTLVNAAKPKKSSSRFSKSSSSSTSGLFTAEVKVTADKDHNALVIVASPTDYLTIQSVIKKLDIPRDQVYVEGMVMETAVSKSKGWGINIIGAYGSGGTDKAGFVGNGGDLLSVLTNNITSLGGLFVGGGTGPSITQDLGGGKTVNIKSISGLITAIANSAGSNVLATPQILALDNEEASFEVGEQVPVPERTNAANGSSSVSIKQQKVALVIKLTPQINKVTRLVKLKIDQQIDDFSNRSLPDGVKSDGVATTIRKAVTTVVVRDRDTIAMGGLMRDKQTKTLSKVPLLGDIPVLGWLFKNTRTNNTKVNLLFFLTPKILDSATDNAGKVKDLLARRNSHLKSILGENDPFASTVKGLYEKAKKQEKGPLFDKEKGTRYKKLNKEPGIKKSEYLKEKETVDVSIISQKIKRRTSALKKNNVIIKKVK